MKPVEFCFEPLLAFDWGQLSGLLFFFFLWVEFVSGSQFSFVLEPLLHFAWGQMLFVKWVAFHWGRLVDYFDWRRLGVGSFERAEFDWGRQLRLFFGSLVDVDWGELGLWNRLILIRREFSFVLKPWLILIGGSSFLKWMILIGEAS